MTETELLEKIISLLSENDQLRTRYHIEIERFQNQKKRAELDRYRLGVIGVTSSGKSTMINAIMGEKLLPVSGKPSSSQLVTCSYGSKREARIYFNDKENPQIVSGTALTANLIQKYSDENFNRNNKENVKQLEISLPKFALSPKILLIDSPGLDAYGLEIHEKLTINTLLPTIDFCIFVTTCKSNSDSKMFEVLNEVGKYHCPIIIVQNMLDSVKPSADGKKSVEDVARESKNRVLKIVNRSAITDKDTVKIIQISSRQALDVRTKHLSESEEKKLYDSSNYNKLIETINTVLQSISPRIEAKRIEIIREGIQKIADEATEDQNCNSECNTPPVFEYEGYDKKINDSYNKKYDKMKKAIDQFEADASSRINSISQFSESDILEFKSMSKECGDKLIEIASSFFNDAKKYCKAFGIDSRHLRMVDSLGTAPDMHIYTTTKPVKKEVEGLFGSVARLFGSLSGHGEWGYTFETKQVYDKQKTIQSFENYIENSKASYINYQNNWNETAYKQVNLLIEEYNKCELSYKARVQALHENQSRQKETEKFIGHLRQLLESIPKTVFDTEGMAQEDDTDLKFSTESITVPNYIYSLYMLSENLICRIHRSVFEAFTKSDSSKNFVIGWDPYCMAGFIKNNFGIILSEETLRDEFKDSDNLCTLFSPKDFDCSKLYGYGMKRNFFIMYNTTQYGAAQSDLQRSGIIQALQQNDSLYLVIQDFSEVAAGDNVKEAIVNMLNAGTELELKIPYSILINDNNPIYNRTAIEMQLSIHKTQRDMVELVSKLSKEFPYLTKQPSVKKNMGEITKGFVNDPIEEVLTV